MSTFVFDSAASIMPSAVISSSVMLRSSGAAILGTDLVSTTSISVTLFPLSSIIVFEVRLISRCPDSTPFVAIVKCSEIECKLSSEVLDTDVLL